MCSCQSIDRCFSESLDYYSAEGASTFAPDAAGAPDAHFELPEGYDEGDMLSILTDAVGELGLDDDKVAGGGAGPQAPSPEALQGGEFSGL